MQNYLNEYSFAGMEPMLFKVGREEWRIFPEWDSLFICFGKFDGEINAVKMPGNNTFCIFDKITGKD